MEQPGEALAKLLSTQMTMVEVVDPATQDTSGGRVYHVLVNPTTYSVNHSACYATEQPIGGDKPITTFNKIKPGSLKVDLLFDATGSLGLSTLNPIQGVMKQVKEFLDMVFYVDANRKQPKTLQIIWGPMEFFGRARSVNISYSHFDSFGQPIRATASCSFIEHRVVKKKPVEVILPEEEDEQEQLEFNRDKHLINGLLKHGSYLSLLAKQAADELPDSLRLAPDDLSLNFKL